MISYPLEVRTPEACAFSGLVTTMTVTGANGQLTVLAGHAPMLVLLADGPLRLRTDAGETIQGTVKGGLLRVSREGVSVLTDSFRRAGEEESEHIPDSTPAQDDLLL